MKILSYIIATILTITLIIYITLFTSIGKPILSSITQSKLTSIINLPVTIKDINLGINSLDITLNISKKNHISLKGNYSLINKDFSINYNIKCDDLSVFSNLIKQKLQGKLYTNGNIKGDVEKIFIIGKSDIASSDTKYGIKIENNNITSIKLNMKNALLEDILFISYQKQYAKANIDLQADLTNINNNILGMIDLKVKEGILDQDVMKNDFNITIHDTHFNTTLTTNINTNPYYKFNLISNLANISSKGFFDINKAFIDASYDVDIENLELLKPIVGTTLKGAIEVNGFVKGDKQKANLRIKSNLASSNTNINIQLKNFKPKTIKGKISSLELDRLLFMIDQPRYANADVDIDIDIKDFKIGTLKGNITTNIKNGSIYSNTIQKEFNLTIPYDTKFISTLNSTLLKNSIDTRADINSSLVNTKIKNITYNIQNQQLNGIYNINIDDLSKLKTILDKNLRGKAIINGDITKADDLSINLNSNILNGDINISTLNDTINIEFKDIDTLKALYMLYYPNIYKGDVNGNIKSDITNQTSEFYLDLKNGHFLENQLTKFILDNLEIDITKENFSYAIIKGNQKKDTLNAIIDMQSNNLKLSSKKCTIDTKNKTIDAVIYIELANYKFDVKIKGSLDKPKISSDILKAIIKSEIQKKIEERPDGTLKNIFKNFLNF